jgi:hypothetical protein
MPEVDIDVITEATTHDLISLADLKIMLDIPAGDTSNDQQLQLLIEQNSEAIAMECNRVFGKEEVEELWQCVAIECCPDGASKIWLSHYPVDLVEPFTVESPPGTVLDPTAYRVEKWSGKLTIKAGTSSSILVHYTGGFDLPDEAPGPLQQATGVLVRKYRTEAAAASTSGSGVRMLAHKDSRVIYFSPKDMAGGTTTSTGPSVETSAIKNLLSKYTRYFI